MSETSTGRISQVLGNVVDVEFPQLLQDMIGDLTSAPEPVVIKLFGRDPEVLREWAPKVADRIKKIQGVVDTKNCVVVSGPAITFKIDPQRASRFGVTADDIARTAETAGHPRPYIGAIWPNLRTNPVAQVPVSDFSDLENRSNVFYKRLRIELHRVLRRSVPLSKWKGWD
jgi:multidrug efflux pump subunit AcrB